MFTNNIAKRILFAPPLQGADTLLILRYATLIWHHGLLRVFKNKICNPLNISLLIEWFLTMD